MSDYSIVNCYHQSIFMNSLLRVIATWTQVSTYIYIYVHSMLCCCVRYELCLCCYEFMVDIVGGFCKESQEFREATALDYSVLSLCGVGEVEFVACRQTV